MQLLEPLVRNAAALTSALNGMVTGGAQPVGPLVVEGLVERCRHALEWMVTSEESTGTATTTAAAAATAGPALFSLEHNKAGNNMMLLLSYLYTFGTVECTLVFDIVRCFATRLRATDVELLLTMMTACGMKMRSDDPSSLKEIILLVQQSVQRVKREEKEEREQREEREQQQEGGQTGDSSSSMGPRMDYMLDTLYDLKNNKTRHRKNHEEARETTTRLNKWLRHMKTRYWLWLVLAGAGCCVGKQR